MQATRWRMAAGASGWLALVAATSCHGPAVLAPPPPLRAASVSAVSVAVEFAESLDLASATDPSHYRLYPVADPTAPIGIGGVALVDTILGRTVILETDAPLPDGAGFAVETDGVRTLAGKSTGTRTAGFSAGLSYDDPMRGLFAQHCDSCHNAANPGGNYRTDDYTELFGNGTNSTPNIIAGAPNCLCVVKTRPGRSMFVDGGLSDLDYEMILGWIVNFQARR